MEKEIITQVIQIKKNVQQKKIMWKTYSTRESKVFA